MHNGPANRRKLGILAGLLLLGSAPSALAQITVDQPTGIQNVACGQIGLDQNPCELLSDGIAEAAANGLSVITVGDGVYAESGMLIDFDLTIEADVGAIPVIDAGGVGQHFVIAGTQASPLGNVRLEGLTPQNRFLSKTASATTRPALN